MAEGVTVTAGERPLLATIPDVELVDAGLHWPLMADGTEDGTFTAEDIAAAIAALDDPSIRAPKVIFGHRQPTAAKAFGPGSPVWGGATNLRTSNEGQTLVCDLQGVPAWLADLLPHAWPSRSIQGRRNVVSETGATHALVIDYIAFLGVELPAISTLEDVRAVYAARTAAEANVTLKEDTMPTASAGRAPAQVLAAGVTEEDVRRAFYEDPPVPGPYPWIRSIELEPFAAIVDSDDGSLWRVPFTISGTDITWGTPTQVRIEYVAAAAGATSASRTRREVIVFASRDESRKGVAGMDPVELRKTVGLAEDATDEEVTARLTELAARPEPTPTDPATAKGDEPGPTGTGSTTPPAPSATGTATFTPPPGTKLVDEATWADVTSKAEQGALAATAMRKQERDRFLAQVRSEGRLAAANTKLRETLEREWDRDPVAARAFADELARVVPVTAAGHDLGGGDGESDPMWDAFERSHFPDVAAVRADRDGGRR